MKNFLTIIQLIMKTIKEDPHICAELYIDADSVQITLAQTPTIQFNASENEEEEDEDGEVY